MPLEIAREDGQRCLKSPPVIVLGSGASIPFGLPSMSDLARRLMESSPEGPLSQSENRIWKDFTDALEAKNDLESALGDARMNEDLSNHVVEHTWTRIEEADAKAFGDMIMNPEPPPLSRLYRHLFDSTHRTLSVVTTNYDRLAEYATDLAGEGFLHYTGFTHGYIRWRQSNSRISFSQPGGSTRMVNIWKVHGCLDWFRDGGGEVVAFTAARSIPEGFRPAIVTPGLRKFEATHQEPFRSVITGADHALTNARAYLCIGFGFNDEHIQPKLMERWKRGEALLVILTKELSESARSMLDNAGNREFLALEESSTGTRIWSHRVRDSTIIQDTKLWRLSDFIEHMS